MGIIEFFISPIGQSIIGAFLMAVGNVTAKHIPEIIPMLGKTNKIIKQGTAVIDMLEQPNIEIKAVALEAGLNEIAKLIDERR